MDSGSITIHSSLAAQMAKNLGLSASLGTQPWSQTQLARAARKWTYASSPAEWQFSKFWAIDADITTSGTSYDLSGTLANPLGETTAFTRINGLYIANSGTAGSVSIDSGVSNCWTDLPLPDVPIYPETDLLHYRGDTDGWAVTAATGDILKLVSDSGTNRVRIVLWGA